MLNDSSEIVLADTIFRFWLTLSIWAQCAWNESVKRTEHSSCMMSIVLCAISLKLNRLFKKCFYICWFVRCRIRRKCGEPCTRIEVDKPFCTMPSWFDHFVHCCIGFLYWAVWQSDEPTDIFSYQWTLLSGSNLSESNVFYLFWDA